MCRQRPLNFTQSFCVARKDLCKQEIGNQASIETDAELPDLATWCRRLDLHTVSQTTIFVNFTSSCTHEVNGRSSHATSRSDVSTRRAA